MRCYFYHWKEKEKSQSTVQENILVSFQSEEKFESESQINGITLYCYTHLPG